MIDLVSQRPIPCNGGTTCPDGGTAGRSVCRTYKRLKEVPARRPRAGLVLLLVLALAGQAHGYGYTREEDPLLRAFEAAVRAARAGDFGTATAQVDVVRWQTDELKGDVRVDFGPSLRKAHGEGATEAGIVQAWANLVYLALLQKFHWNLQESLADYHKARPRLEAAQAYYEAALAGNVRRHDEERRKLDPRAPSRHDDIVARFAAARQALGSPGLFGSGARPADPAAFRAAVVGIAGHLRAVFPGFAHPAAQ
jgi:hypothetical protein